MAQTIPTAAPTPASAADANATSVALGPVAVTPAAPASSSTSPFDDIWGAMRLYRNEDADVLNEVRLVGRVNLDNYMVDAEQGDSHDFVARRVRLGARARLLHNLDIHVETDLNLEGGPVYTRLTDAYVAWRFSDAARLTVGKQSVKFTLDGGTSSSELLTIDRSNVANNFWFSEEYIPGASVSGRSGAWSYTGGVYSSGRKNSDFGHFDGGAFVLASLGRDFASELGVKRALVRVDYVYNDPDPNNSFTRPFQNVGSLAMVLEEDDWGLSADVVLGDGYLGQSNAMGTTILPWVDLTDRLQLAGRYTYLHSSNRNGLRLARYENTVVSGRGDEYQEAYAGLNYYIYGHKLKLQTGVAYATMRDRAADGGEYDGVSWTTGLRLNW